eukprot:177725-Hanusia_phi.AAC.1
MGERAARANGQQVPVLRVRPLSPRPSHDFVCRHWSSCWVFGDLTVLTDFKNVRDVLKSNLLYQALPLLSPFPLPSSLPLASFLPSLASPPSHPPSLPSLPFTLSCNKAPRVSWRLWLSRETSHGHVERAVRQRDEPMGGRRKTRRGERGEDGLLYLSEGHAHLAVDGNKKMRWSGDIFAP